MPSFVPCKKNDTNGYTFYPSLASQANTKIFQASPTLAGGDVKISIDDGAPANLATLPVVDADFTKRVKVVLSQAETNGDNLTIIFSDAAGAEWCDLNIDIRTVARQIDDLAYPATSGRSFIVESDGMIHVDLKEWLGVAPLALNSQRVQTKANVVDDKTGYAIGAGGIIAASFGAGALDAAAIAANAIGASELAQAAADLIFGTSGATLTELSQGAPPNNPRPDQALMALYMALINKLDVDASNKEVHNAVGTRIFMKNLSDDGSVYSEAKAISGA